MPRKIEISHRTIIFTVLFLVLVYFLYLIRDIILQVFVALLIMVVLNPLVRRLSKLKIPRALSVTIVYILVLGVISGAVALVISPLIEQTANFASSLPRYVNDLNLPTAVTQEVAKEATVALGQLPGQVLKVGISVFSNVLTVLAVFIFAFYLLLAREKLAGQLAAVFGEHRAKKISEGIDKLEIKMGGWVRAQLIVMFLMGFLFYLGLTILRIPFALPLALLVGILEIIPTIGPIVAVIPAIIVGLGISPITGLAVAALSFLMHQLENYVFVPKVMQKSVGVSPLVTLLAIVIGLKIAGVVGAILSVPVVITLEVIIKETLEAGKPGSVSRQSSV